jgi:zinc protease
MKFQTRAALLIAALAIGAVHAATPGDVTLPKPQRFTLKNGAQVFVVEKRDTPLVALDITVRGGPLVDPAGKDGTAALLTELMEKGAGKRNASQFAEAIASVGGALGFGIGTETIGLNANFLAKDVDLMLELASDALIRPTLAKDEFEKVRTRAIQSLAAAKDSDLRGLTEVYGYAWMMQGHPYGRPGDGDETTLAAISHADVQKHYAEQLGGDRLIIAVVGDVKAGDMKAKLERAFGGWRKASGTLPTLAAAPRSSGRRVLLIDKPGATQTYFWLANVGVDRKHPQRAAQTLVNTVFGGRFTSMLNTELRIKSGLSYGAGSGLDRYSTPGAAYISSFTRTDATEQALDLALVTLGRLHAEGISGDMLESARNYVLGQFPPTLETNGQIADRLTDLAFYGLTADDVDGFAERVAAVDAAAAKAAIAEVYPKPDDLTMVLIGDAAKIRDKLTKYGPVTEMKITDPRFTPN